MGLHTYAGWRDVPPHLFTRSQLRELEFPREPVAAAKVAIVHTRDWSDHEAAIELYDMYRCPPTSSSAGSLAAAAARATRPRVCADCGACGLLRPLVGADGRALCSVCFSVVLLRRAQAERAEARAVAARDVAQLLTRDGAAVLQVDLRNPGPTPGGSARRDVAARIRAVDLNGRRLLDVLVDLTGARSKFRDPDAVAADKAAPPVHKALLGRPLIAWQDREFAELRTAAPHPDWPRPPRYGFRHESLADVAELSRQWRGQLDERRNLLPTLHPGSPDRLLLHLQRIAATHTPDEQRTEGPVTAAAAR